MRAVTGSHIACIHFAITREQSLVTFSLDMILGNLQVSSGKRLPKHLGSEDRDCRGNNRSLTHATNETKPPTNRLQLKPVLALRTISTRPVMTPRIVPSPSTRLWQPPHVTVTRLDRYATCRSAGGCGIPTPSNAPRW